MEVSWDDDEVRHTQALPLLRRSICCSVKQETSLTIEGIVFGPLIAAGADALMADNGRGEGRRYGGRRYGDRRFRAFAEVTGAARPQWWDFSMTCMPFLPFLFIKMRTNKF